MNDGREMNRLLRFLQDNAFQVAIVEGPRGVGKSTFIDRLLEITDFEYYKTWGRTQKTTRFSLMDLGLDLPQATYYMLDLVKQVPPRHPILSDRGNLSALVYQSERYGKHRALHRYYAELMRDAHAVLLVLSTDIDTILSRRVARTESDEQSLHRWPAESARQVVRRDVMQYDDAVCSMLDAGLKDAHLAALSGVECSCYVHKDTILKEIHHEDACAADTDDILYESPCGDDIRNLGTK